ncbi:hypothetical protein MLD38_006853 [Melastoma candidum]|uniref:Uncharacterized protein n=1 Tax=Melastoma candidum TaxID=119954 RepID=A0ACB9RPS0_9MYRT|nr:hypothetical protein MLD38_006853 [Melastoma candidum]
MLSLPPTDSKLPSRYVALGRKTTKILDRLPVPSTGSCFCVGSVETREGIERRPLFVEKSKEGSLMLLEDRGNGNGVDNSNDKVVVGKQAPATKMKPEIVMLRVSMHCNSCAKKVEKHVSKIEGVSCYKVDLESKMVVIIGDVVPIEVLDSVSKVKRAEFWASSTR